MKTLHVRVEGRVQGVYFRDYTRRQAQQLGLKGWVMNKADGAVECVLQGEHEVLEEMTAWLYTGSPHSLVTSVVSSQIMEPEVYSEFIVRY